MTYVQVKRKYQVTIPAALRKRLNLHEGDMLEVREQEGVINDDRIKFPPHITPIIISKLML
ncbi:AbrB/MazE/SpoVT family DNA-binding domain-containing protein [Thiothrix caldifontis]|uniref:AbrB/MazE/SpoVT family DNA-binding domain-containing protein n=1 Tax=Thiothrix caldifontis TaxID=525918 RepID=UPI001114FAF1|nr:AbrB/MazE/SpoVT family DNA-binding domain-containing protein [Thiothrix caldifontis]